MNTYLFHDGDSDSLASRARDRRAASIMRTDTTSIASNSEDFINGSESNDETTVRTSSSKPCESKAPATEYPGPLDDLHLGSDNSKALDKLGMSTFCPIKIEDDSNNDSSLAYLANQEILPILLHGKKRAWAKSYSSSKFRESVRANGGKKTTSYHSP